MTRPGNGGVLGRIRTAIKSVPYLHGLLFPAVNALRRARDPHSRALDRFRKHCSELAGLTAHPTFAKVGANDGVTGDPCSDILLSNAAWRGVLIEPVPYCFERLGKNFGDAKRFSLEQVAIGAAHGKKTLYYVAPEAAQSLPGLPSFFDQLGSFDRGHILRHLDGRLEPFIVERDVEVCTLSEVLERNAISDLHLLHVDVEGYDYEVLKSLDFARHAPLIIFIEHKHLSDEDRAGMTALLHAKGYTLHDCGSDYFALDEAAYGRLKKTGPTVAGEPRG
jgi:FkbM family methyltransferase